MSSAPDIYLSLKYNPPLLQTCLLLLQTCRPVEEPLLPPTIPAIDDSVPAPTPSETGPVDRSVSPIEMELPTLPEDIATTTDNISTSHDNDLPPSTIESSRSVSPVELDLPPVLDMSLPEVVKEEKQEQVAMTTTQKLTSPLHSPPSMSMPEAIKEQVVETINQKRTEPRSPLHLLHLLSRLVADRFLLTLFLLNYHLHPVQQIVVDAALCNPLSERGLHFLQTHSFFG